VDATFAKGKSLKELQQHYGAVMGVHTDMPMQIMPTDHAYAILDAAGTDLILNFISLGWTRTEIASHFKVPAMAFAKWTSKRLDPEDLAIASKNFADALLTRAMYVLSRRATSPAEQSSMKALSKVARDIAACADPEQWMPAKIAGVGASSLMPVQINIDIGSGLAQGGSTHNAALLDGRIPPSTQPGAPSASPGIFSSAPTHMPGQAAPSAPDPNIPTIGWVFGDMAPAPPTTATTKSGNPPTEERPNG